MLFAKIFQEAVMAKKRKSRIVLIESTESEKAIANKMGGKTTRTYDLWVRTPDSEKLDKLAVAARLCRCRSVCIAVVEDQV